MKHVTLIIFILLCALTGFSQKKTYIGLYGGGGLATRYNYDVSISGGLDFVKAGTGHFGFGFSLFYQSFGIAYDNEAYGAKRGVGNAGAIVLNKSAYVFLAPKFDIGLGKKKDIHFYVNAGPGFNMGGTEVMRKWDRSFGAGLGNYDSTIVTTANINKMVVRVAFGFTQHLYTSKHWRFSVTEDFGFVAQSLSTTSDYNNPSRTNYTPRSLNPSCISLIIGITHVGFKD